MATKMTNLENFSRLDQSAHGIFVRAAKEGRFLKMKKCDCLHKRTGTEQTLDELDWERELRIEKIFQNLEKLLIKESGLF